MIPRGRCETIGLPVVVYFDEPPESVEFWPFVHDREGCEILDWLVDRFLMMVPGARLHLLRYRVPNGQPTREFPSRKRLSQILTVHRSRLQAFAEVATPPSSAAILSRNSSTMRSAVFRPMSWLRLAAGGTYNFLAFGLRQHHLKRRPSTDSRRTRSGRATG